MKNYVFLFLIFFFNLSCSISPGASKNSENKAYNTLIIIHYKSDADKAFTRFQQYDLFGLKDYGIIDPPAHKLENEELKTVIKFNLEKPMLLLLGFNEFYIEPNTTLDFDYFVIKQSKDEFTDTIRINSGTGFIIKKHSGTPFLNTGFVNRFGINSNGSQIDNILNKDALVKESMNTSQKIYSTYPNLIKSDSITSFIQQYDIQNNFLTLILKHKKLSPLISKNLQEYTTNKFKKLSEILSRDMTIKTRKYWIGMRNVYEQILDVKFKRDSFYYDRIKNKINNYDSITQQFFMILSMKDNYYLLSNDKFGFNTFFNKISFVPFISYLEEYKKKDNGSIMINSTLGNSMLYDYSLQKVRFNDLFTNSSQKYIYLDFCGSWCKPCLDEIEQYSIKKIFDNSAVLKPVWLFFENNKMDWFRVIDKYNLKKENCFLVIDDSIIKKSFSILFSWQGEFPHHFIFSNNGKIIDLSAVPLISIDDKKIAE